MWIPNTGGVAYLNPDMQEITIAMTNPTGIVVVEQMGVDKDTWFGYRDNGESADLDIDNTAKGIYAPIKLRVTATGTGVRLYHRKAPNRRPVVIQS